MNSVEIERVSKTEGDEPDDMALPVVIRPQRLLFDDIESRLRCDREFAACLRERPAACATVARAVLLRDRSARSRFANLGDLVGYLRALAGADPTAPLGGV